eukprot:CAMPEP_0170540586 /NCGR_PEP_ID=MMETSP0211-20121228/571_1 /TAXON_ID=311385 /ORGANISM="Pseudokeronopsis sp., Strain OXSARD2" /LENGTH=70 /DNA_ID=CAMNT_0010843057 /DNA_START=223 /DNA_END=435 /DNA_ORIENTATION=-
MDKNQAEQPINKYVASENFQTSNNAYHQLTHNSQVKLNETGMVNNDLIEKLDPAVFEVAAKKTSPIWHTQ